MKGLKKMFHLNGNQNRVGLVRLITDKIDFKSKLSYEPKEDVITNH